MLQNLLPFLQWCAVESSLSLGFTLGPHTGARGLDTLDLFPFGQCSVYLTAYCAQSYPPTLREFRAKNYVKVLETTLFPILFSRSLKNYKGLATPEISG